MDKTDVREWFETYAVDMGGELNGGSWSISGKMLDEAAKVIAQDHQDELAAVQAQVAVMSEALDRIEGDPANDDAYKPARTTLKIHQWWAHQALSAAPKVLLHAHGKYHPAGNLTVEGVSVEDIYAAFSLDCQQVEVFVVRCQRHPEEGAESEQCLPKGQQAQESEQEAIDAGADG